MIALREVNSFQLSIHVNCYSSKIITVLKAAKYENRCYAIYIQHIVNTSNCKIIQDIENVTIIQYILVSLQIL